MNAPNNYSAMTVNERIFVSGQWDASVEAIAQRDEPRLRAILSTLDLTPENVDGIIAQVFGPDWPKYTCAP